MSSGVSPTVDGKIAVMLREVPVCVEKTFSLSKVASHFRTSGNLLCDSPS